jgi:hypothetical protein
LLLVSYSHLLVDAGKQVDYAFADRCGGGHPPVHPDEGNGEWPLRDQTFVVAVSLPDESLDAVALHSPPKAVLGHADEELSLRPLRFFVLLRVAISSGDQHVHSPEWEGRHRVAVALLEERVYGFAVIDALTLAECRSKLCHAWVLVLAVLLFQESLECGDHRGILLCAGHERDGQSGLLNGLARSGTEGAELERAVLDVGERLCEIVHTSRCGEDQHVTIEILHLFRSEVVAQRAIHHTLSMVESLGVELVLDIVVMYTAQWHEISLLLVLHHHGDEVIDLSGVSKEYLSLAILYVFLDIEGNGLGDAEIFHVFRNGKTKLVG